MGRAPCCRGCSTYEPENLNKEELVVVVISTYEGGTPPESAAW